MRTRHFLVERNDAGLRAVYVFDDQDAALKAYEMLERSLRECVLLGADSLATCIKTHGSWFDEMGTMDELLGELGALLGTDVPPEEQTS